MAVTAPLASARADGRRLVRPQLTRAALTATCVVLRGRPPSDAFQGDALADLVQNLFGYSLVAAASSTDSYGSAGIAAFLSAASERRISILASVTFAKDATDFLAQYSELHRTGARVIIIFCPAADAGPFMKGALYDYGIGGPGYVWLGSDSVTISDTWTNNGILVDPVERLAVLKGYVGVTPSRGTGTPAYNAYLQRMRAVPPTTGNGTSCDLATDDDTAAPTYIWAQDIQGDGTSELICGGNDNQQEGSYASYAYDAVYAIAYALHHLIETEGRTQVIGSELYQALISNVAFDGATGRVEFFDGSAHPDRLFDGDRRVGVAYEVFNFVSVEEALHTWPRH